MLIWILIVSLVFSNFEYFPIINDLVVAECVNKYFSEVLFDDLFPIVQVLILKVVN